MVFSVQSNEGRKTKSKSKNKKEDNAPSTNARTRNNVSHDLNLKASFTYRMQNALNRNIQTAVTTATGGATAYRFTLTGDYTFSRLLSLTGFLDWQRNVPLVSQSSYPTTTADFGISMKFSLTR